MGGLRLIAWLVLLLGVVINLAGVYLIIGLAWSLIVAGVELAALGLAIANMGNAS